MTSVYIIGRYSDAERAEELSESIAKFGVETVSSWHTGCLEGDVKDRAAQIADEIDSADVVIAFQTKTHGGNAGTEVGYAIGAGKVVVIVGDPQTTLAHRVACSVRDDEEAQAVVFGFHLGQYSRPQVSGLGRPVHPDFPHVTCL